MDSQWDDIMTHVFTVNDYATAPTTAAFAAPCTQLCLAVHHPAVDPPCGGSTCSSIPHAAADAADDGDDDEDDDVDRPGTEGAECARSTCSSETPFSFSSLLSLSGGRSDASDSERTRVCVDDA